MSAVFYSLGNIPQNRAFCYCVETIRKIDATAISGYQMPLMRIAGQCVYRWIEAHFPLTTKVVVIAGSGNNGGDAWECAVLLTENGFSVHVFYTSKPRSADALNSWERAIQAGISSAPLSLQTDFSDCDLIVDGLVGSGLSRQLSEEKQYLIRKINDSGKTVLSLDIPSGLHSGQGAPQPVAIRAAYTITFVGLKVGLFINRGRDHSGTVYYSDLGIPDDVFQRFQPQLVLAPHSIFLPRLHDSHKKSYGEVWVVGGQPGMPGAVVLSALAALRTGCGLVKIVTHSSHAACMVAALPEAMCYEKCPSTEAGAKVIGPGMGQGSWAKELLATAMDEETPLVMDADALRMLAKTGGHQDNWILTPHPGEAADLLDCDIGEVQRDRMASVRSIAQHYGGWAVLKGSSTVISDGATVWLSPVGNPAMASAGMGDVLSGIIASLAAQGLTLQIASCYGVYLHAATADALLAEKGWGLRASDVADALRPGP